MRKIDPSLASGFRDYLPEDMIPRQKMLDTIRVVFERFGFVPLDTPAVEREDILTGGDEDFNKQIFRIASNKKTDEETESGLALRFDLTVPLARVVAANSSLGRPFKRYQIGKVFRAEKPQMGRFREFTQCDVDIVGSSNSMADAEIIAVIYEALSALGVKNFTIRIGNRKVLAGLIGELTDAESDINSVLRIVDKLDKIGWDGVLKELDSLNIKLSIEELKIGLEADILAGGLISKYPDSKLIKEGVMELTGILDSLNALNIPKENCKIDLSIARGLAYYTGTVFETILNDLPQIGSVFSGGRYDGLIEKFSSEKVPAIGASIGIDRLFVALEKLGKITKRSKIADVLFLNFDGSSAAKVQTIASLLRRADLKTEIYLGNEDSFKGQLAYAVREEFPVVVIIGPKEMAGGFVQVKDMKKREQFEASETYLVGKIKEILKENSDA